MGVIGKRLASPVGGPEEADRNTRPDEDVDLHEIEHDDGDTGGVKFASTLLALVSQDEQNLNGDDTTKPSGVLSKRKTLQLKEIEAAKRVGRQEKQARLEKRAKRLEGMVEPALADRFLEKKLRKIATKGVVMLFNKIQDLQNPPISGETHEADRDERVQADEESTEDISKNDFLGMLRKSTKSSRQIDSEDWEALNNAESENEEEFELESD